MEPRIGGTRTCRRTESQLLQGFRFSVSERQLTQQKAECRRSTQESDALYWTSPARELAGGITRTVLYGDDGLAPRNGAHWKSKPALMGAVVSMRDGRIGEHHPMGLSYS